MERLQRIRALNQMLLQELRHTPRRRSSLPIPSRNSGAAAQPDERAAARAAARGVCARTGSAAARGRRRARGVVHVDDLTTVPGDPPCAVAGRHHAPGCRRHRQRRQQRAFGGAIPTTTASTTQFTPRRGCSCARRARPVMQAQGHEEPVGQPSPPAFNRAQPLCAAQSAVRDGRGHADATAQLAACYRACLSLPAQHGLSSVAFCVSTGVFHFPIALAARIAVQTVRVLSEAHRCRRWFSTFSGRDRALYEALLRRSERVVMMYDRICTEAHGAGGRAVADALQAADTQCSLRRGGAVHRRLKHVHRRGGVLPITLRISLRRTAYGYVFRSGSIALHAGRALGGWSRVHSSTAIRMRRCRCMRICWRSCNERTPCADHQRGSLLSAGGGQGAVVLYAGRLRALAVQRAVPRQDVRQRNRSCGR